MAEITFNKVGEQYVAEFEATADFNLHIEGLLAKDFVLFQRSTGSQYDVIADKPNNPWSSVFDYDFTALVYPKYIKIVSEVEPTYAEVVTDGEITEIKSQSKSVEIVANGTTNIAPDAGYSYLSGVSVKVNVPQEGGGSGGNVEKPMYVGISLYDTNSGAYTELAISSEYTTWQEVADNRQEFYASGGGIFFWNDYGNNAQLYNSTTGFPVDTGDEFVSGNYEYTYKQGVGGGGGN